MMDQTIRNRLAQFGLIAFSLLVSAPVLAGGAGPQGKRPVKAKPRSHADAIRAIAKDIAALKASFPQLADFDAEKNCHPDRLMIDYERKTHPPKHRGGWTAGVPNPDPDGVWFYIDFHDPKSTRQIHTQPVVPELRRGDKRVMFLILEGEKTKNLSGPIREVLNRHGVTSPKPQPAD